MHYVCSPTREGAGGRYLPRLEEVDLLPSNICCGGGLEELASVISFIKHVNTTPSVSCGLVNNDFNRRAQLPTRRATTIDLKYSNCFELTNRRRLRGALSFVFSFQQHC